MRLSLKKLLLLLPIMLSAFFVMGQPSTFTYQIDGGTGSPCAPTEVNFFPVTTLTNPTFTWQVNGVTFSNQEEPIRIFPIGGVYNVCLQVSSGGTTEMHCEQITVFDPPTITLDNDVTLGCSPLAVNFILTSTSNIDSVVWDLGDGTVISQNGTDSVIMIFTHDYLTGGTYSPIITVFDENGCKSTVTKPDAVTVIETATPAFSADASIGCTVPHAVNFSNNTSMSSNLSFVWDFGVDASSTSTQVNPSYTYTTLGSYDVSLIVTNDDTGCSDTLLLEDFVSIGEFNGFQYEIIENEDCSVTEVGFSFFDSGNIQSVSWDFGDGNSSSQVNPIYTYTTAGCFTPTLSLTTTDGCNYTTSSPDCINSNGPLSANYTASGDLETCDAVNGTTINFTGISSTATSWSWDFGGLGTSNLQNPSFTFTGIGEYPVELTVLYPDGCEETITNETVIISDLEVEFSSNVVDGCEDLQVFFSNETDPIDPIISFEWDFGGGTGLTNIENPVVMYTDTGSYDVTLTVETASGCIGTLLMENYIEVGMESGPGFSADPLISCLEDEIEFTSESGALVDEWEWHFGDGGQSMEENPKYEYTDTGSFDVMLITYFHGCPDTLIVEDYIFINVPKAEFSFDQDCSNPGVIQFFDESAGAETWAWDFGDGNSSSLPNPAHTYAANGTYTVSLTVSNSQTGCEHTEAMTIVVTTSVPEFILNDYDICIGDTLHVINSSTGADCYTWTFPFGVGLITNSFCDATPSLFFPSAGTYSGICVTISDGSNCTATYCLPDIVTVSGAVSDFATNDTEGCVPHTVNFNNTSSAINGTIANYQWDFGDSTTSTAPSPSHTYTEPGIFAVSLIVENQSGCNDSLLMDSLIIVDDIDPFFIPQVVDCAVQSVDFTNASTAFDTDLTYLWDFGDGGNSSLESPSHAYASAGTYSVCLTVSNSLGCSEQFCDDINFQPLSVDFTADNTYKSCPEPPLLSTFTDLSVNAASWSWDFGDGALSSLQHPSHSYNQTGSYTVCLTVTNVLGCSATECKTDYIVVDGPSGVLTVTPTQGCADLEVQFIIESQNAHKYIWDFGDGFVFDSLATGSSDTINYTYSIAGTYKPVVLVEDISGCQIPIFGDTIIVEDILSDFTINIDEVCEGAQTPVDFEVSFLDPSTVISVNWEFPGSSTPTAIGLNPTGIIYDQPGYYSVIVTANTTFCQAVVTKDSFVFVHPAANVDFTMTPSSACDGETIDFEDISTISADSIVSWNWTIDNNTFTGEDVSYEFTSPGTYNIVLETTSSFGCTSSEEKSITIFESPNVEAGDNVFLCKGDFSNLVATVQTTDPVTYAWSPTTGLSCDDCSSPTATPNVTTMYFVTATSANGCTSVDSVQVEVSGLPIMMVTTSADTTICEGESATLSTLTNHVADIYEWDMNQAGLSCYDCPNPIATPDVNTTYNITIYSDLGCAASSTVTVNVIPTVDLIDDAPIICIGESVQLNLSQGSDFLWQPAAGLSCTDCQNPIASPDTTTTYTITALINNQCTVTDEITITVLTSDDIDAGDDFTICEGVVVSLDATYPSGSSVWTYNGDVFATDTANPDFSASQSGNIVLEVTNGTCVLTDTIVVEVRNKVEIFAEDVTICQGDTAYLEVTGDADTYLWIDSPGISDPTSSTPFATPNESVSYLVIGQFGDCESDTILVNIEVLPLPEINAPSLIFFTDGEEVQLDAGVNNPTDFTYLWSPPIHLNCTDCPDPIATPEDDITYQVSVFNALGCVDTANVELRKIFICNDDLIVVPNAFTPNGDGNNDRFNVMSKLQINVVRIYNRWGEVIFENEGGTTGWDGTYKGQKLNRDVFVYYIEATCEFNGKSIVKTGDVTLIR